jgi:hypothetical protein
MGVPTAIKSVYQPDPAKVWPATGWTPVYGRGRTSDTGSEKSTSS